MTQMLRVAAPVRSGKCAVTAKVETADQQIELGNEHENDGKQEPHCCRANSKEPDETADLSACRSGCGFGHRGQLVILTAYSIER